MLCCLLWPTKPNCQKDARSPPESFRTLACASSCMAATSLNSIQLDIARYASQVITSSSLKNSKWLQCRGSLAERFARFAGSVLSLHIPPKYTRLLCPLYIPAASYLAGEGQWGCISIVIALLCPHIWGVWELRPETLAILGVRETSSSRSAKCGQTERHVS